MKRFTAALIIFLITIGICIISSIYVVNFCNKTDNLLQSIIENTDNNNECFERLTKHFNDNRILLTAFLNHDTVQDLEIAVFRFCEYHKLGMNDETEKEAMELKMLIEDIKYNGIVNSETFF